MKVTITFLLFIISYTIGKGQQTTIQGTIVDDMGLPLTGATIHKKYTNNATISDTDGHYELTINTSRQSTIVFSMVGCLKKEISIEAGVHAPLKFDIVLEPAPSTTLNEAVIIAKSNIRLVEETGFNVVAIDAKPYHNSAINLTELLNQTPGVKINQEGGLGSKTNVTINGLSGNHIRFFIDGMPMDAMSSSFQLNNLPVNMAERIEVYKGVVPVNFGSDALGGAVNIVTKKTPGSYLDASYSYGSFNTHLSYINAGHTSEKGFTIQLSAYQNYSDNSYYVDDVSVLDFETNLYTDPQRVKRFHDTYHNETVIVKTGIVNKPFADQLLFGFTLGQEYKEIQHPAYINPVYGDKVYTSNTIMPSFLYSKDDLFVKHLDIDLAANYNLGEGHNVDTSYWQYNWLGQRRESPSKGEVTASDYRYNDHNGTINACINYEPFTGHRITINNVTNLFSREGDDILDTDDKTNQHPRENNRNILGIGLGSDFGDKMSTSLFAKRYSYHSSAYINVNYADVEDYQMVSLSDSKWGYGFTFTYFLNPDIQLKANYELTCRMPESQELFGQVFTSYTTNFSLKPESSNNLNLGIHINKPLKQHNFFSADINLFYRRTEDFIKRVVTVTSDESHENISLVRTPGIDAELRYSHSNQFTFGTNISYQRPMKYDPENDPTQINALVPNEPNFFGNADAGYFFNDLWLKDSKLTLRYHLQFIYKFLNEWNTYESAAKNPTQWNHGIGMVYSWKKGKYNLSVDGKNIFDAKLYDNFSLQKPGRSFSVKFRYFFNKM